jgi:hypothetical protein
MSEPIRLGRFGVSHDAIDVAAGPCCRVKDSKLHGRIVALEGLPSVRSGR